MTKSRTLNLDKVSAALKRAGRDAVSGGRNAQSGRFTAASASKIVETSRTSRTVTTVESSQEPKNKEQTK